MIIRNMRKRLRRKLGSAKDGSRGILICGSGFGVDIAANKIAGVRSALAESAEHARIARHDDDANILALAADSTSIAAAERIAKVFLETPFAGEERYKRRLTEIKEIEKEN